MGSSGWCVWAEAGTGSISRSVGSAPPLPWVPLVSDLRSLREKEVGVPRTHSHGEHDYIMRRWRVVVLCESGGALVVSAFFPGLLIRCPKWDLINQVLQVNSCDFSTGGRVAEGCWPT